MRPALLPLLLSTALFLPACATTPGMAGADAPVSSSAAAGAPISPSELVRRVAIPYQEFKLDNGLTGFGP
jgi:hypothetical protein